ncbi:MAG: hypothetical protein HZA91_17240 [Verrucomicrobia bacterium]|nr:hypothetical protein [Verrucomicrobiota bacterium]
MVPFRIVVAAMLLALLAQHAGAQVAPKPAVTLVEKPWGKLSYKKLMQYGEKALGPDPDAWRHAETEHFVFHYHELENAQKVGQMAEAYYQQIKSDLGVTQDRFIRKNHVFIFDDEAAWKQFGTAINLDGWASGLASRTELFLFSPKAGRVSVGSLGHEIAHCIFYRFVPKPVPLWLNEGFAEYESSHAYAQIQGVEDRRFPGGGPGARFPLPELLRATKYPKERVGEFYWASERLVRFLLTKLDRRKFLPLVQMIADGTRSEDALVFIYNDRFKSLAALEAEFAKFNEPSAKPKWPF